MLSRKSLIGFGPFPKNPLAREGIHMSRSLRPAETRSHLEIFAYLKVLTCWLALDWPMRPDVSNSSLSCIFNVNDLSLHIKYVREVFCFKYLIWFKYLILSHAPYKFCSPKPKTRTPFTMNGRPLLPVFTTPVTRAASEWRNPSIRCCHPTD